MPDVNPGTMTPEQWGEYLGGYLRPALEASAGTERRKLEAQVRDAEEGRKNSMAIARLQSETSRYGVDAQTATSMATLKQRAHEFEQTHALELKKFGLSYAQTATEYLSTPDRFAQSIDFFDMAGRVMQRQGGPAPYGSNTDFVPKTQQDFAVLAGGAPEGQGSATPGSTAAALSAPPSSSPSNGPAAAAPGAQGAAAVDPRTKVMKTMIDAIPPSRGAGMDANDFAVMKAAEALYSTNLPPGAIEKMRPGQQGILSSFVKRSGRDWNDYLADVKSYGVGQGSARRA